MSNSRYIRLIFSFFEDLSGYTGKFGVERSSRQSGSTLYEIIDVVKAVKDY